MPETDEFLNKEPNSTCIICGNKYYVCGKCKEIRHWKTTADNTNCYKIFMIIQDYLEGRTSKEDASKLLTNVDLSNKNTYADWVQTQLTNILE